MKCYSSNLLVFLLVLLSIPALGQSYRNALRKANDQYALKAYSQAIESYEEVLARNPEEPEALERIADCYANLNQMDQAADYLAKLVRQRDVRPVVLLYFGQVLKALGRYEEAKNYFAQYARTDPSIGNHFVQSCDFAISNQSLRNDFTVIEEKVNSTAADFGPVLFKDKVVFASSRTDIQRPSSGWDGISKSQLFIAQVGSDMYLQPATMLKYQGAAMGEGPAAFTADGRFVAYTRNNFVGGVRQSPSTDPELSIFLAEVNAEGAWINERSFIHNTAGKTGYPSFTSDGDALFFASARPEGYGGYDLYISYKEGSSWTKPINLGPTVNTPGDEVSPFFDGTNLYFASDWHAGFGGMDIFLAEQRDGRWSKVTNVGLPVNSSRDDYGFVFDKSRNYGLFVSNRPGGRGAEDLYHIRQGGENLLLRVVNAADGVPIQGAAIDLSACVGAQQVVYTDNQGQYAFPLPSGTFCQGSVTMAGYQEGRFTISETSLSNGKALEITLTKLGHEYVGFVISSTTNLPLQGVTITVRNLNEGSSTRVVSDQYGQYFLALHSNTPYSISYSAQGYQDLTRTISTPSVAERNILGTTPLATFDVYPPTPGDIAPRPPVVSSGTNTGFAIQIASMNSTPDLNAYSKLKAVGSLYATYERAAYKVRVGPYATKEEASRQLPAVKRVGYSTAFVVAETASPGINPVPPSPVSPVLNTQPIPASGQIMIQLAAYSNTRYFDPSKVSLIGPVIDRKKGNLVIKLITGFYSMEEAKRALPNARQAGFAGAFIVIERNGILERVP